MDTLCAAGWHPAAALIRSLPCSRHWTLQNPRPIGAGGIGELFRAATRDSAGRSIRLSPSIAADPAKRALSRRRTPRKRYPPEHRALYEISEDQGRCFWCSSSCRRDPQVRDRRPPDESRGARSIRPCNRRRAWPRRTPRRRAPRHQVRQHPRHAQGNAKVLTAVRRPDAGGAESASRRRRWLPVASGRPGDGRAFVARTARRGYPISAPTLSLAIVCSRCNWHVAVCRHHPEAICAAHRAGVPPVPRR